MFFTRVTQIVAIIMFVAGVGNLLLGFGIASGYIGPYDAVLKRYTTASSSGEVIDKGFHALLIAIALGTLVEISLAVRMRTDNKG